VSQLAHNRRHFELEMTCVSCHLGVAHPRDGAEPIPSREVCIRCHGTTFQ
jgi:nitrate/TMAO reductase-like tetraheme cytochrome c subunit